MISPMDEAEIRVLVREVYKKTGKVGVLKVVKTIVQSAEAILEALKDFEYERQRKQGN